MVIKFLIILIIIILIFLNYKSLQNIEKYRSHNKKILILCHSDLANCGKNTQLSLENQGYICDIFKGIKHKFNYLNQANLLNELKNCHMNNYAYTEIDLEKNISLQNIIDKYNIILFNESLVPINLKKRSYQKMGVIHGGVEYRINKKRLNDIFNKFVDITIIRTGDLYNNNAKNSKLLINPINLDYFKPNFNFKHKSKLIINHSPSKAVIKGTPLILKVINDLKGDERYKNNFNYIGITSLDDKKNIQDWNINIKKYLDCDIYIETIKPTHNVNHIKNKKWTKYHGKEYKFGEWGVTCMEAASSGCIVLTNSFTQDLYLKYYKIKPVIIICNDEKSLKNNLIKLFNMNRKEILNLKKKII